MGIDSGLKNDGSLTIKGFKARIRLGRLDEEEKITDSIFLNRVSIMEEDVNEIAFAGEIELLEGREISLEFFPFYYDSTHEKVFPLLRISISVSGNDEVSDYEIEIETSNFEIEDRGVLKTLVWIPDVVLEEDIPLEVEIHF